MSRGSGETMGSTLEEENNYHVLAVSTLSRN
jgi:hypothetical protein